LAFAREHRVWDAVAAGDRDEVTIATPRELGNYRVPLAKHLAAVGDDEMLFASVLIHSYALAESAAALHLGLGPQIPRIETWANRLIERMQEGWDEVKGGLAGLVEVAVVRNAFVHGNWTVSHRDGQRLARAGITSRPGGSRVTLGYHGLRDYRGRLLSVLNAGGAASTEQAQPVAPAACRPAVRPENRQPPRNVPSSAR
jgi:hypothetical protein